MSTRRWLPAMTALLLASTPALADNRQGHCDHGKSLAKVLEKAKPGETIHVSGQSAPWAEHLCGRED